MTNLGDTHRTYAKAQRPPFWEQAGELGHKYIFFAANLFTGL